jgi:uncharacterized repeat protein (TIGR03803 family)
MSLFIDALGRGARIVAIASSVVLAAGCASNGLIAHNGAPAPAANAVREHDVGNFTLQAAFPKTAAGAQYPSGNLVEVNGKLYGIAQGGPNSGDGTIFSVTGSQIRTVYRFNSRPDDGNGPNSDIVAVKGATGDVTIYGTTQYGGINNHGTIFSYDVKTDKESVVYSFQGNADGASPGAGVIYHDGALYGTTRRRGENGKGGLFKFALPNGKAGVPVVLHQFGPMPDASDVEAPLLYHNGMLWGVSKEGGEFKGPGGSFADGYGSLFKFGLDGSGGVCSSANGDELLQPDKALVNNGDAFLVSVGSSFDDPDGFIWTVHDSGCRIGIPRDGRIPKSLGASSPSGALVYSKSDLIGVLFRGGPENGGVVYRYTGRAGPPAPGKSSFEILHTFTGKMGAGSLDGCKPDTTPILADGTVYGTTKLCGKDDAGTVWSWR